MATYLIAGASRGIGFALVEQALAENASNVVIAAARKPQENSALVALQKANSKRLSLVTLDVDSDASVQAAYETVSKSHTSIDFLIHNAGVLGQNENTSKAFTDTLNTNVIGPLRVVNAFLPLVQKSQKKVIIGVSSEAGTLSGAEMISGFYQQANLKHYAYRVSKTAVNALFAAFAFENKKNGLTIIPLHPGLVRTDMASGFITEETEKFLPSISATESAKGILAVAHKVTVADTGKFYNYKGEVLPW